MAVQGETFSPCAREGSECQLTFTCLMDCIANSLSAHPNAVFPPNSFFWFICISLPWLAWPGMETATQVQVNTLQRPALVCCLFLAQIPSVKREGESIASGECDDDVEHRAHVLPCLCTQIPHLQTVLKTGERNHEMKGQVLSTFNSNSDSNCPYFYLFASFPEHCGQPMKSIPRKEATFF